MRGLPVLVVAAIMIVIVFAPANAAADTTPPWWSDSGTEPETIYESDVVTFFADWNDDVALSGYIFSTNQSGAWVNESFTAIDTPDTAEQEVTITASAGTTVGWRFYANDTSDNWNVTDIQSFVVQDETAPASITDLQNTTYQKTYINWIWTDLEDNDFSHVMVYLNGTFETNVTKGNQFYSATGLTADTEHEIATRTVDNAGNINDTWKNDTARTAAPEPETPSMIYGWVFYKDGTACDNPTVNINNTNTSKQWQAETNVNHDYYQLILDTTNISVGNVLEFNAASPNGNQTNVTEHTVTQDDVNNGGIFSFNITLASPAAAPTLVEYIISNRTITSPQTTDIDVKFSEKVKWKIAIENGGVVYDWTGTSTDPNKRTWDGTYKENDTIVPDGTYTVNITWTNTTTDLGGQNNTETITVSTSPDTTSPIITNITNTTPTDSSAIITWTTDENSDSLVKYGTASGTYTNSESDAAMVASHSITLTGLSSDMTYYFVVNSTDASNNSNESEEHNFTMAAVGPPELISCVITPTPPVVQGTNVSIDCLFSERVGYEIRIENATGALTEEIGSGTATNPDPKWWNTTTGTPAGIYIVNVTMDNSTGLSSYNNTNTIEVTDASDTTAPTITDNSPTGTDVPVTTNVTVTFDEAMNKTSAEGALSIMPDVTGTFSWSGDTMIFTPDSNLAYDTTYNITIGTDAKDLAGIPLAESFEWNFTTTTAPDYSPSLVNYTISNTTISPNGDGVMDDTEIDVEFSETVDTTILIENATGIIRMLYTGSDVTDPDPQRWNGTDNDDNIVAGGTYHVNITMDDGVNPMVYDNTGSIVVANISAAIISIGNVSGNTTVPITIEGGANVGSAHINITYNASVCMITDVANGTFDYTLANIDNETGWASIGAWQGNNSGLNGSFILANVTFRSNSTNGTSPLNLSVVTFNATNPPMPLPYIVQNGTYTALLNGDVNGDGEVDIADAMYLAKHVLWVAGWENINEDAADVDGIGGINLVDVMYLTKHVLGKSGFEELR